MMLYYRVRLSQASHYSISTVGTGSKMFLQKNRGSSSDKDFREMVLQKEANLGEKSLRISIAEPVGNCFKVHSFDENRPKVCFPVVYHR